MNIALVTSVIHTTTDPFHYTNTRSIFSAKERFNQTINTLISLRNRIPNVRILFIECSPLTVEETTQITEKVDYFMNVVEHPIHDMVRHSPSKSLGEGLLTIYAIQYLVQQKICFDCLFKISGRYILNEDFQFDMYNNTRNQVCRGQNNQCATFLYKLNYNSVIQFVDYLMSPSQLLRMKACVGYEIIFAEFIDSLDPSQIDNLDVLGVSGRIAVDGAHIEW